MRITATDDGELLVGRRLPGRGAWVCPIETCVAMARRRKAFARALRHSLADGADDRFVAWFAGISGGTTTQTLDAVDAIDIASPASSGAGLGASRSTGAETLSRTAARTAWPMRPSP